MLVAGGHLDKHALVVVADPVYLNITTVSGIAATNLDEDLGPVPGGATSTEWTSTSLLRTPLDMQCDLQSLECPI